MYIQEEKKEIWLSPMTKASIQTEQNKWQYKNATKNFDYTTIADRLRKVSWCYCMYPTGVVKPDYVYLTFR